ASHSLDGGPLRVALFGRWSASGCTLWTEGPLRVALFGRGVRVGLHSLVGGTKYRTRGAGACTRAASAKKHRLLVPETPSKVEIGTVLTVGTVRPPIPRLLTVK